MRHRFASTVVLLVMLAACGGSENSPTSPGTGCSATPPLGTMTANVGAATFSASLLAQATIQNSTANGPNIVQVSGAECPSGGALGRQIVITIGRLTPITTGTYQLDPASQGLPAFSGYSGIGLYSQGPNQWYANLSDASGPGSGSITFTSISATRLIGTFQLVAVAANGNGTTARQRMTVTSGAFNVSVP